MFLIVKDQINNLILPPQVLDAKLDEYRFIITKGINTISKIGNFYLIDDTNCVYWNFQLDAVDTASENLSLGMIDLQSNPGIWYIEIQTKNVMDTEWAFAYKDMLFIALTNIIQTV